MSHRGAHPHTVEVIRRGHAETSGVQTILVVGGAEPRLHTSRVERLLDRRRGTCVTASDGNRSLRTVAIIILNVEITLRSAEIRHDFVIRPFVVAESRPRVEVFGKPPLHSLTVDRRPAADHLPLRNMDFTLFLGDGASEGPVVL